VFVERSDIFFLAFVCALVGYWYRAQRTREIALHAVRQECKRLEVQLLDQSVSLRALWFKRDEQGSLRLWRRYQFEFSSTGEDRYLGQVMMLANRVTNLELEAHRLQ